MQDNNSNQSSQGNTQSGNQSGSQNSGNNQSTNQGSQSGTINTDRGAHSNSVGERKSLTEKREHPKN
jgi:hypothetical protein